MNIMVVGCGKVGLTLADQLIKEGHSVTIIDNDEHALHRALDSIDVMGIFGNGAVPATQIEAGIQTTDILIAATGSDEINMLCCLIAKKSANCRTIARIRDPQYYSEVNFLRDELNLAMVINPEMTAAREAEKLLRFPSATKIDRFARGRADMYRIRVPEGSPLCDKTLTEIGETLKYTVLICLIQRMVSDGPEYEMVNQVLIPNGNNKVMANDTISFVAAPEDASRFFQELGVIDEPIRSCIIIGGGRISYYILKYIQETHFPIHVKILDTSIERCNYLAEEFPDAEIINGDGTDQELLRQEGIEGIGAFLSLTGFDEENIMLSLYAGKLTHARLITKINRIAFENVTQEMNLGSVIYPKQLTADSIVSYVRALENSQGSNIETLYKIADGRAEALEFKVENNPKLVNIPFSDLQLKKNVLIAAIIRDFKVITPDGQSYLKAGDRVIVVTTSSGFHDLKDILQ